MPEYINVSSTSKLIVNPGDGAWRLRSLNTMAPYSGFKISAYQGGTPAGTAVVVNGAGTTNVTIADNVLFAFSGSPEVWIELELSGTTAGAFYFELIVASSGGGDTPGGGVTKDEVDAAISAALVDYVKGGIE